MRKCTGICVIFKLYKMCTILALLIHPVRFSYRNERVQCPFCQHENNKSRILADIIHETATQQLRAESRKRQQAASIQARELQSILVRCSQRSSTELEV